MIEIDYKTIKEAFFESYKSYMNYLRLTITKNAQFNILISRENINNNLMNVTIIINSINASDLNSSYNYKSNTILNDTETKNLIDDIRTDFREKHYITYSSTNSKSYTQTLQNTNFTLLIELKNNEEIEDAMNFNQKINCNRERHKVLTKN